MWNVRSNIYNINYQFLSIIAMINYWKNQFWKKWMFLHEKKIDRILVILKFDEFTWCKYLNIYRPVRFFSKLTFASGPYVINAPITIIRTIWMKNSWYTCCFPLEKNIPCSERKKKEMNKTRIKMFIRFSFYYYLFNFQIKYYKWFDLKIMIFYYRNINTLKIDETKR